MTVVMRAVGGTISNSSHPANVTAVALGLASGSIFALVSRVTPPANVGSVTGIVGAVGGLGGFVPPLVIGAIYSAKGTYSIGLMLLSDLAFAGALYSVAVMHKRNN